jgi:hypothetical protein
MKNSHRFRKTLLIIFIVIVILVGLIIVFISPLTKYMVQKYDTKYLGREITMDWAYVNPFTGYIHFEDFKIMEQKNDTVFFAASSISANFEMMKLLTKTFEISELSINDPHILIKQTKGNVFNFTDIIEKFTKKDEKPQETKAPIKFNLLNITIINGEFFYEENLTPVNYSINKVNIECTGKYWNADTVNFKYAFSSGVGTGDVKGTFDLNLGTSDYRMGVEVKKFDLTLLEQYLKVMMNYGKFRAIIDADMKATGNFNDAQNINMKGIVAISDFHFGKNPQEDFASFDKFEAGINQLNPKMKKYMMDSISLAHPFIKYEKYDKLDNIQNMFGRKGENVKATAANKDKQFNLVIEIANYVKLLSKNFFKSDYKIGKVVVYNADIRYIDYSQSEKFEIALDPFKVIADSLYSDKKQVSIMLTSGIKPYGNLFFRLGINPKDSSDFELNYNIEKINAAVLNPYLITATSFPLDRGSIAIKGNWVVKNGEISSKNHLIIIDPRISNRMRMDDNKWLPLKLAMIFVRERGNAIDYEVPITGNLKDPEFHLRDVILDIITNIFVKSATPLYRSEIKTVELEIEKHLAMKWLTNASTLLSEEVSFAEHISKFLADNPNSSIIVSPILYIDKEKEYILLFEAKKKYFLQKKKKKANDFTEEDSLEVFKMATKDSLFTKYLNDHVKNKMLFTVQAKCEALVGSDIVQKHFEQLSKKREEAFLNYFTARKVNNQVKIKPAKNEVPFNGFSYYRISYNGQIPDDLKEAFYKLNEYDNNKPRKKLKEERKKTRNWFKKGN